MKLHGITIIMFNGKRPREIKYRNEITFRYSQITADWIIKAVCSNMGSLGGGIFRFIVKADGKRKAELNHLELKPYLERCEQEYLNELRGAGEAKTG
jgi:hypothetical protein